MSLGLGMCKLYPLKKVKTLQKRGVLSMTQNCIWWWSSSSGDPGSVEHPFIVITSKSTVTQRDVVFDIGQRGLFENYLY